MEGIFGTNNLSVIYNKGTPAESVALRNLTFHANEKEFVVVFGPSGCGKSTLLYTLSGIERHIDSGDVWLGGKSVSAMSPTDLLELHRRDVGMIFQAYNLVSTLNVLQNVTLPLLAAGALEGKRRSVAEALLERFCIGHLAKRYPSQLSGGQQQRVAIARALVTNPDIIVADEPTGNLDSQSAEIVLRELLELNIRDQKTVLLVTHDPSFLPYADRVIHMKDGTIVRVEEKKGLREFTANAPISNDENKDKYGVSPFDSLKKDKLSFEDLSRVSPISDFVKTKMRDAAEVLLRRFEHILIEVALGKLSHKDVLLVLEKPVPRGGMGFSSDLAMSTLVELEELFFLRKSLMERPVHARTTREALVTISSWLLGPRYGTLASIQSERMDKCIESYLFGTLSDEGFIRTSQDSVERGGIGLLGYDAREFTEKLNQIKDLISVETPWPS